MLTIVRDLPNGESLSSSGYANHTLNDGQSWAKLPARFILSLDGLAISARSYSVMVSGLHSRPLTTLTNAQQWLGCSWLEVVLIRQVILHHSHEAMSGHLIIKGSQAAVNRVQSKILIHCDPWKYSVNYVRTVGIQLPSHVRHA